MKLQKDLMQLGQDKKIDAILLTVRVVTGKRRAELAC